jgi:CTP synthase
VISAADVDIIYKQPLWLHQQGLDDIVVKKMGLDAKPADLSGWQRTVDAVEHPKDEINVAIVGKYVEHKDAYKSLGEALRHGGIKQQTRVNLQWIDSEQIEAEGAGKVLGSVDAILVPGGFGKRGFEGKVLAAKYAREHGVPYFGICYGMHAAVVDFARNVAGLTDADSSENDRHTQNAVIGLITEWTTATGEVEQRSERSDLGGQDIVRERHRHRYEFNNRYRQSFEDLGMVISGKSMDDLLVEIVELPLQKHPWFLGCQAHPEFTSTPRDGHPLFIGFVRAAREFKAVRDGEKLAKGAAA